MDELAGQVALITGASRGLGKHVANLVVFLLSDRSSYMTGQAINLTGGEVVW